METKRTWSHEQETIFNWFESHSGHLIVEAYAGCGKTTTIVEGANRAPEDAILICAYNKRIAEELVSRVRNPNVQVKTLHAVGYAAVRRFWEGIRCSFDSTRADALAESVCGPLAPDAIKRLVSKLHTKGREIAPHATKVGDLTDMAITFELEPDEQWNACRKCGSEREWHDNSNHPYSGFDLVYVETKALEAMELAATVKPVTTGIDGSDMIFLPVRNGWLHKSFDLVVVDEAQDMTVAQLEIAQGVCRGRICVVGDPNQAIYGFLVLQPKPSIDLANKTALDVRPCLGVSGLKSSDLNGRRMVRLAPRTSQSQPLQVEVTYARRHQLVKGRYGTRNPLPLAGSGSPESTGLMRFPLMDSKRYAVTVTHIARESRRRIGKARIQIVESTDPTFANCKTPLDIEQTYERAWDESNPGSHTVVKVTDTREIPYHGSNGRVR